MRKNLVRKRACNIHREYYRLFAVLLELLSLADGVKVFFHTTGEDELHIRLRFVIDQEIQFAAVEPCFSKLIFHGNAVNGEVTAIVVPGPCKFGGLGPPKDDFIIPWESICRIGPDIVLVDIKPDSCRVLRGKPRLLF